MPNAAAAAKPPVSTVWSAPRSQGTPVNAALTAPKMARARRVTPTETKRAERAAWSRTEGARGTRPMTMSRTVAPAVKCCSTWGVAGMAAPARGWRGTGRAVLYWAGHGPAPVHRRCVHLAALRGQSRGGVPAARVAAGHDAPGDRGG